MQKEILLRMLEQNRMECSGNIKNINPENAAFRLTQQTASVGFIYRHIGETANLLGHFFGYETEVAGTTLGQTDSGKEYDLDTSRTLFEQGYATLEKLVHDTPDEEWLGIIDTAWFGSVSRIRLFAITLFHNSHHCGQIASAIVKGKKY
jgi:uncharacterized damage-inducible protein DinB